MYLQMRTVIHGYIQLNNEKYHDRSSNVKQVDSDKVNLFSSLVFGKATNS